MSEAAQISLDLENRPLFSKDVWALMRRERVDASNFLPKLVHLLRAIETSEMSRDQSAQALITLMHLAFEQGEWTSGDSDEDNRNVDLLAQLHTAIETLFANRKGTDQTTCVNQAAEAAQALGQNFARVGVSEEYPDNRYLPGFLVGMEVATQALKEMAINGPDQLRELKLSTYLETVSNGITTKVFGTLDREGLAPKDFTPELKGYANWIQSQNIADSGGENVTVLDDHRP